MAPKTVNVFFCCFLVDYFHQQSFGTDGTGNNDTVEANNKLEAIINKREYDPYYNNL